jgi:hypothetical protein
MCEDKGEIATVRGDAGTGLHQEDIRLRACGGAQSHLTLHRGQQQILPVQVRVCQETAVRLSLAWLYHLQE